MTMDEMRELVVILRERAAGLKEAANDCSLVVDCLALRVRADETEHCIAAIDAVIQKKEGDRQ